MTIIQLGNITVQRIIEHEVPVYHPMDFFSEATEEALAPHRAWLEPRALCPNTGLMVMPVQSYLVRTSHHNILIDTCCGCNKTYAEPKKWHQKNNQDWLSNLIAAGINPEEIDYVFCTHLHSDHCGWNTQLIGGRWVPTFPNAKYIFSRIDYQAEKDKNHQIFIDNVLPVMEAKQAQLVDMDYALDDEVWLEPTPGHTEGHVAVHMKSGAHHAVMCGDLIHTPLQLAELTWTPTFEYDMVQSSQTRQKFLSSYCETDTLILTAHFPSPSVGHIIPRGKGYDFSYI